MLTWLLVIMSSLANVSESSQRLHMAAQQAHTRGPASIVDRPESGMDRPGASRQLSCRRVRARASFSRMRAWGQPGRNEIKAA